MLNCDIYSCEENIGAIVLVAAGSDPVEFIPNEVREHLGELSLLKSKYLREGAGPKKTRRNCFPENGTIIHIIKENGYYVERY